MCGARACLNFRFVVIKFISIAREKPRIVIIMAVSLRYRGIVI